MAQSGYSLDDFDFQDVSSAVLFDDVESLEKDPELVMHFEMASVLDEL